MNTERGQKREESKRVQEKAKKYLLFFLVEQPVLTP
jgi:hypothetical protein